MTTHYARLRDHLVAGETANIRPRRYITCAQLAADSLKLASQLPPTVDAIVGIARSGMIPAAIAASLRHLPLFTTGRGVGIKLAGHGERIRERTTTPTHVALVDDTTATGREICRSHAKVQRTWPAAEISRCVVYAGPGTGRYLSHFVWYEPHPHWLEWNWPNAPHTTTWAYDLDGILCHDYRGNDDDSHEYREHLRNATPFHTPRSHRPYAIITARCEKYRPETQAWLRAHGITTPRLIMGPWRTAAARRRANQVAIWKAKMYGTLRSQVYIESDDRQAQTIATLSNKVALCPTTGKIHG